MEPFGGGGGESHFFLRMKTLHYELKFIVFGCSVLNGNAVTSFHKCFLKYFFSS